MPNSHAINRALRSARHVWRAVAPVPLRGLARPVLLGIAEQRVGAALASPEPPWRPGPIIVSGLLSGTKGVSEAARLTLAGIGAAGMAPVAHDLATTFARGIGDMSDLPAEEGGGAWIVHVNAPEALLALACTAPGAWRGRKRIAYWAWELPRMPDFWIRAARAFDEIWTPSAFTAGAAIASGVGRPVRIMPHPVALNTVTARRDRAAFGMPADAFCVLATGDLNSSAARKNLIGAIEIYLRAFPEESDRNRLVIKVQASGAHPRFRRYADKAVGHRRDISVLTETLSAEGVRSLIASADVLLSPHRSEGYGLTLAEAFLLGVPALATGWSGNMDYMTAIPELTIRYRLIPVADQYGVYRNPDQIWAEPDPVDAAAKLRTLSMSANLRDRLAAKGRAAILGQTAVWSREMFEATGLAAASMAAQSAPAS